MFLILKVESCELTYKLESFIKRMKSKKFIESVIENPAIFEEIQSKFSWVQSLSYGTVLSTKAPLFSTRAFLFYEVKEKPQSITGGVFIYFTY